MLNYSLLHPVLLTALSELGHGGQVVLADANFPLRTALRPEVEVIHLNLRPGMVTIPDVLEPMLEAVSVEAAAVMSATDGGSVPRHDLYRDRLGDHVPIETIDRWAFYDRTRGPEVGTAVVTGDETLCANLILTLGVRSG